MEQKENRRESDVIEQKINREKKEQDERNGNREELDWLEREKRPVPFRHRELGLLGFNIWFN